jgi:hypothetical protein
LSHSLPALIEALRRLPGVGQKTASRMAYHLLQHDREGARQLVRALDAALRRKDARVGRGRARLYRPQRVGRVGRGRVRGQGPCPLERGRA